MSAKKKKLERYNVGKEKKIGEVQCRQRKKNRRGAKTAKKKK
jgi:hypothetical protein